MTRFLLQIGEHDTLYCFDQIPRQFIKMHNASLFRFAFTSILRGEVRRAPACAMRRLAYRRAQRIGARRGARVTFSRCRSTPCAERRRQAPTTSPNRRLFHGVPAAGPLFMAVPACSLTERLRVVQGLCRPYLKGEVNRLTVGFSSIASTRSGMRRLSALNPRDI